MLMITLHSAQDISLESVIAVAHDDAPLTIAPDLLAYVAAQRARFDALITQGVPCYGVTTGLGNFSTLTLSDEARTDLAHNILRARAAAIGEPLPRPVVRSMMMIRLFNFLSGGSGVSAELCQFIADRLNDNFTPWVPSLGHGMAADAIANTHCFQTLIGEGFVLGADGEKMTAMEALQSRNVAPLRLRHKEGLALLNGIAAAPAYALHVYRQLVHVERVTTAVAAVSFEGVAAPRDSVDVAVGVVSAENGTKSIINAFQKYLAGSQITPSLLQSPVSYRIIPQLHGAYVDALADFRARIVATIATFSDNPLMDCDRFLSVGLFHNQHLVNQAEHVAIALAHVGALSSRRLHRLLSPKVTNLPPQLAARPGLDAGLVVAHKATIGLVARLKWLANPISLATDESSAGQEDYMSQAFPVLARLEEMAELTLAIYAYELLGALEALRHRGQTAGDKIEQIRRFFAKIVPPFTRDRSVGVEVEKIVTAIQFSTSADFSALLDN